MTLTGSTTAVTPMVVGGERMLAADGAVVETWNPATGELLGSFPDAGPADVDRAVQAARTAFPVWRALGPQRRGDLMNRLADVIDEHAEELLGLDVAENGTPVSQLRIDAVKASRHLRYFSWLALEAKGESVPTDHDHVNFSVREPYGAVGRIIPFNHPLQFAAWKISAPLAAGNTVVLKPSELTSLSALRMAELATGVLPDGVLNVVTGYGRTAGDALVRHPDIRRIAFTGSPATGRAIQAAAASVNVKHVTLELGGKNPLVVFADADLDRAVQAAICGMNFTWQGQSCGSTSRLLVQDSVYDDFIARLAGALEAMRPGDPRLPETQTGAIVSRAQYDKVLSYIELGRRDGARLVAGGVAAGDGELARGLFVRPTLFADVDPASRLAREEIFGPILAAFRFSDYDDAIAKANDTELGLSASVYTSDLATAMRFGQDIQAGYVWVNEISRHFEGAGFGGYKDSGVGREENLEELLSYTQSKNIHINFESGERRGR